ncbi:hypothetical protein [Flocculibacter collagenilyticus]|uniref:hypothetical protein n=1 Tax=Flocculibacter collagenilyticus TaxID=2744479 RepID=UPI0018F4F72F|nr:hypothetical protein [Flocculibacter collagenilyticus]
MELVNHTSNLESTALHSPALESNHTQNKKEFSFRLKVYAWLLLSITTSLASVYFALYLTLPSSAVLLTISAVASMLVGVQTANGVCIKSDVLALGFISIAIFIHLLVLLAGLG